MRVRHAAGVADEPCVSTSPPLPRKPRRSRTGIPPHPHDAFFRRVFSVPRHAAGLLRIALPPELQALLDLDPARVSVRDPTHVGPRLRGTASDVVLQVPRRNPLDEPDAPPALVIFALEHQRRDERFMALRLHTYAARLWERWLREHPKARYLPPIVPVLIHTGRRPWRSPTRLSALIDLPPAPLDALMRPFLPEYGCVLLDLAEGGVTREWLRGRAVEPVSATALEILQAGERPEAATLFAEWLERLAPLRDEPGGASTLAAFLCYLLYVSPIPDARIVDAGEDLPGPASEEFMTAAQQMMARARQEGRQEGLDAGEHAALAAMLLRLARLRFGEVPAETAVRIEAAPKADLERFIEGILTAERLNDLFG